jgi:hypothetical protein
MLLGETIPVYYVPLGIIFIPDIYTPRIISVIAGIKASQPPDLLYQGCHGLGRKLPENLVLVLKYQLCM